MSGNSDSDRDKTYVFYKTDALKKKLGSGCCGPERDQVTVEWRKLHKEELRDFYSSPNIAVTTSIGIKWAEHVARM